MLVLLALALLVLLALPWALLALDVPLAVPLGIDLALVLVGLVVGGLRLGWSRWRARSLERALAPSSTPARAEPDAEIAELSRELAAALAVLDGPGLSGGGRAALDALPWYAVLGATGSGKTSLVRGSGLTFPSVGADARARATRGVGGTRRCDVWLANEAVLLDTAGRWTTSESGREWAAFVSQVKKHRGARGLDGAIVAVSLESLLDPSPSARRALARALRDRLDELVRQLGVAVPVYVLVTQCDRLPGFAETFGGLERAQRDRAWGYALGGGPLEVTVKSAHEALVTPLRVRMTQAVADERRREARALIAELPAHLASLGEPLATLASEVFVPSAYGASATLRGVYFTSAAQEGRPVDRLLGESLRRAGVEAKALPEPILPPRATFVHDVFARVVLPDAATAAPRTRARRRRAWVEGAVGAGLAGVAACLVLASTFSWRGNRLLLDGAERAARALPSIATAEPALPASLEPLRAVVAARRVEALEGAPLSRRYGLDQGRRVLARGAARYGAALRDAVVAPLLRREGGELAGWGEVFERDAALEPTVEEHARATTLLERQLRLGAPRDPGEPALDERHAAEVARALAEAWCARVTRPLAECEPHAALFVSLLAEAPSLRAPRDEEAIRLGRLGLSRAPTDERALAELVRAAEGRGYELTLARIAGASGRAFVSSGRVRGAFTRRGWDDVVRARIEALAGEGAGDAWMLGTTRERTAPTRAALRTAYFAAYVAEWEAFLGGVRVTPAHDPAEALALLEDLGRGAPPPLSRLLVAVDANAHLDDPLAPADGSLRGAARDLIDTLTARVAPGSAPSPVTPTVEPSSPAFVADALARYTRFAVRAEADGAGDAPLGADAYRDELGLLRDALATYQDDPSTAPALEARVSSARRTVDGLVAEQSVGARAFFEAVLRPPVETAASTSSHAMASAVGAGFCAAIVVPFAQSLAGHYPFAASGDDAALGDVAAFYRPGSGIVWTHYDAALAPIAPRAGAHFALAPRFAHGSAYSRQLPSFLERAQAISTALFPPGASDPRVELDLRVHPTPGAASVRVSVGGNVIDYRNGPETWSRVVWPGERPEAGARIEVEGARGLSERLTEDGEWGLFRLVEAAAQIDSRPGDRTHTVRWHLPGHDLDVVVDVRTVRAESPLFGDDRRGHALGPLRGPLVAPPRRIASGSPECAP